MAEAPKKRRVRNPETFRERAVKAADEPAKTSAARKLKTGVARAGTPIAAPIGRVARRIAKFPALSWLRKPLRLVGRILLPVYLRNSWKELRKVQWPNRRESFRLTFAVLLFAAVFGAAIAGVDYGLDKLFRNILLK